MKTRIAWLLLLMAAGLQAQVAINTDGSAPDNSAMLDVRSGSRGVLIPGMPYYAVREIESPAHGLLVFQTDCTPGLYFNAGTPEIPSWKMVGFNATDHGSITDADGDTFITTDEGPDQDIIRFYSRNANHVWIDSNRLVVSSGYCNVFIGDSCGTFNTTGSSNLFIGFNAGARANIGVDNVALGSFAGYNNHHHYNTFVGAWSGRNNYTGWNNTFLGYETGFENLTGRRNVFIGYRAGYHNTDAENNTFVGTESGFNNSTGVNNVYVGNHAGRNNETGNHNVFIGYMAGINETGSNRLYISGSGTDNPLIYGIFDEEILKFNVRRIEINSADSNVILGSRSGALTTGAYNVFVGDLAGEDNTTGTLNVFNGAMSGKDNVSGSMNVFLGPNAGGRNTEGSRNTFVGSYAGGNNTTGWRNTYIGLSAGYLNSTGHYNTFIGRGAGYNNSEGSGNIFIGSLAGYNETGSDKLYISNSDTLSPLIYGEFDNSLLRLHGRVEVVDHDVFVTDATKGIILRSPDGQCWRVIVDNEGTLSASPVVCP